MGMARPVFVTKGCRALLVGVICVRHVSASWEAWRRVFTRLRCCGWLSRCAFFLRVRSAPFCVWGFVLGVLGFGGSPGYALGRVAVFCAFARCWWKGQAL